MASIRHQFVQFVPDVLEDGILYVTMEYATAVHRCFCGCGAEVVTPLSPTDWKLTFDGVSVTLYPSIGSWSLPCQSHYWIERNSIIPARRWSRAEIAEGRDQDRRAKDAYYGRIGEIDAERPDGPSPPLDPLAEPAEPGVPKAPVRTKRTARRKSRPR